METGGVTGMRDGLSPPLELSNDFDQSIDIAFSFFNARLNNKQCRPSLFGKNIFIEANELINDRPVGFWHVVSMEESHTFKVLPCTNDNSIELCSQNCNRNIHQIAIRHRTEVRNICILRASRIPWIVDIIELANHRDPSIKVWLKQENGKQSPKLYLRYRHGAVDYVVIFSAEAKFYRLISAFPVFYISQKENLDKDYTKHAWSYMQ